ncbi:hypothetical protein CK203_005696 [Vitis vinifera]|uniref:Uncharacterized protein n=1 Tax=Vitis vinifera TaxID=29760 RepID=A0A438K486_VITVI|nr:hypothetical protein CK203_005696 [Vitis vinifera]
MGGSRVQVNKAHKTRFSSKSSRQVHKTSLQEKKTMLKKILNLVFSDIMHPFVECFFMFYAGELEKSRITKPGSNVAKGAKAARLQRNKMIRDQKRAAILKEKRASSGSTSPPRVIVMHSVGELLSCSLSYDGCSVIFGLSASVNVNSVEDDLLTLLSSKGNEPVFSTVASSEYKLRTTVGYCTMFSSAGYMVA